MPDTPDTATTFEISRLHYPEGIFKLSGRWQAARQDSSAIVVGRLYMMASDGWEELNLVADDTQSLIKTLLPQVRKHLQNRRGS